MKKKMTKITYTVDEQSLRECKHILDRWRNYCVKCHKRYLLPTKDKDGFGVSYIEWDEQRKRDLKIK